MNDLVVTNATLLADPSLCTLDTCPLSMASVEYIPSLAGNALYISIFGVAFALHLGLGIWYKTWTFMIAMLLGLAGELVGYAGRLSLHDDPFSSNAFLQYLVSLTIAPAFLSAAIYLCLSRIVVAYGERISYFRPRTYTMVFIAFDFIALLLQAIGGGIAASTDGSNAKTVHLGKNIMIGGLAWQVASLLIFAGMSGYFVLRVRRASPTDFNYDFERVRHSRYFKLGMWGLGIATLAIFVRSVFRCAELSEGFDGTLANDEVTFMILEGAMICIAVICQTVFHPGAIFKGQWHDAVWHTRASKETTNYPKATSSDSSTYSPSNPAYDRYAQA